jgi:hypothetical protein
MVMLGLVACLVGCPSSSGPSKGQIPQVDPKKQFPPGVAAPAKPEPGQPSAGKPGAGEKEKPTAATPTK